MMTMLGIHIWSQMIDYSLGLIGLVVFTFKTKKVSSSVQTEYSTRKVLLPIGFALFLLLGGIGLVGLQLKDYQKLGAVAPPSPGVPVAGAGQVDEGYANFKQILEGKNGFIVWSSNRFGNHDILYMSTKEPGIKQLTTNPHVDYFPRI